MQPQIVKISESVSHTHAPCSNRSVDHERIIFCFAAPECDGPVARGMPADACFAAEAHAARALEGCRKASKHNPQHQEIYQVACDGLQATRMLTQLVVGSRQFL